MNIYLITNQINGKVYVGKTDKTIEKRLAEHLHASLYDDQRRFHQAIRKHGRSAFAVTLLEVSDYENAGTVERKWIKHYKSKQYKFGYNMTDGGEGTPGILWKPETRERLRVKIKSRIAAMTPGQRCAMTLAANTAKRGSKEQPSNKKEAQLKRWAETSVEERNLHGLKTWKDTTPEERKQRTAKMSKAFSPARVKGVPQPVVTCPHCSKLGGRAIMGRFHFDNCKLKPE